MQTLIVKTSSLGDIIQTFPVLSFLVQVHGAEVDWVVEAPFAPLVEAHPEVRRTIVVDSKRWRPRFFAAETRKAFSTFRRQLRSHTYDWVLDLQSNAKSALVTALAKSEKKGGFGYATVHEWPNLLVTNVKFDPPSGLNIREDYLSLAKAFCGSGGQVFTSAVTLKVGEPDRQRVREIAGGQKGPKIMVCPGAQWTNKVVSDAFLKEFLNRVIDFLKGQLFIIWGNERERALAENLKSCLGGEPSVVDRLPLPTLQNLMGEMDLVVSMDSLPLHLCATTSTPSFSFFGPSWAEKFRPEGVRHGGVQGGCPYGQRFPKRCPLLRKCATAECIKNFDPEVVFYQFRAWWQSL